MPITWPFGWSATSEPAPPKIGRPRRDRRKINASRRTARRNRKK